MRDASIIKKNPFSERFVAASSDLKAISLISSSEGSSWVRARSTSYFRSPVNVSLGRIGTSMHGTYHH